MVEEITLLTEKQYFDELQSLDIISKYGTKASITDFAILLGGAVFDDYHTLEGNALENRACNHWTRTPLKESKFLGVSIIGNKRESLAWAPANVIRPVLNNMPDELYKNPRINSLGVIEIEYGEYPQKAVGMEFSMVLEDLYQSGKLAYTGKKYTTNSRSDKLYGAGFDAYENIEYEYMGKRYVRIVADLSKSPTVLSNGESVNSGDIVWVEVQPITWLIDENEKTALSKKGIVSGIKMHRGNVMWNSDWNKTEVKMFLENILIKEIAPSTTYSLDDEQEHFFNPYAFIFNNVSEEDIIKGAVESGVAVYLHGASSEGKSGRVKQLDPDLEVIYLRNSTPDSLNGKCVVLTNNDLDVLTKQKQLDELMMKVDEGQISLDEYMNKISNLQKGMIEMFSVPPTWFKKLVAKCEAEPDKIHIVFFDEITNALPSIQGMAYNIILDREVNGIWKLPKNARIVAAGNEMQESLAANKMAEPLFNRFAHVYIHTTVEAWLEWAITPEEEYQRLDYQEMKFPYKIHPAIVSYIAYKREQVLRTKYTGYKPNADPRKWEMASKMLYQTQNPEMLRALIGKELTIDFVKFCQQQVITLEDVVLGNYDKDVFEKFNFSEKWATTMTLLGAKENDILIVSDFVEKLGSEYAAMFYTLWCGSNYHRKEIIADIRTSKNSKHSKGKSM